MNYLLDTSVIIEYFRKNPKAGEFIDAHDEDDLITSAICEAELGEGIYREKPDRIGQKLAQKNEFFESLGEIIVFDRNQADIAGKIRAELSKKGSLIGDLDILIAAAALSQNTTLVTKNPAHFQKIPGLQVAGL